MTSTTQRRGALALLLVWFAIAFISTWFHEPWRDEADPWLYARDVPWSSFFTGGRYSGTPALWFLVQAPFARLGAPYAILSWIHLAIATTSTWVFLSRAPLPWWARAVVVFSFFGAFEYAVVARSYALTLLLLWAACAYWTTRHERPWCFLLVGMLAQTNIPGMILAGALLGASMIAPRPRHARWSFFLVAVGLYLLAVLQVWPPDDGQKSLELHKEAMARAITNGIFPWGNGATKAVVAGLLLGLMVASIARYRVAAVFYCAVLVGFTILFELVHEGALRHHGFLLFAFVAATWIAVVENGVAVRDEPVCLDRPSLRTLFAVLALVFFPWVVNERDALRSEVSERFSNGPAMGRFLRDNGYENRPFVLSLSAVVSAPWIVGDVYYPAGALTTKYLAWNALQFQNRGMGPNGVLKSSKEYRQIIQTRWCC